MLSAAERGLNAAAVVGVAGLSLNADERWLFEDARPLGFILFARNCQSPEQVSSLVQSLRDAANDVSAPVFIDQEGGRVTRLKPPHWPPICALRAIGELAKADVAKAEEAAWVHARLIAADLEPLGITVNCAPVLDLGFANQTEAIGDRTFSDDPKVVASLGRAMIKGYMDGGVLPVIKHLPGHGRATVDSHLHLPKVGTGFDGLKSADWMPFCACADAPFGMTAHILYQALDAGAPATQSKKIITEVIRGEIGFEGALLSDDLSMKALGGSLGERAAAALQAGCDLALHCNGDFEEMSQVLAAAGTLHGEALARVSQALDRRTEPLPFDAQQGRERLDDLLGQHVSATKGVA